MKKLLCMASVLTLTGCYNLDTGMIPIGAAVGEFDPNSGCMWDPAGDEFYIGLRYDPVVASSMLLAVQVQNTMEANTVMFSSMTPMEVFTPPNRITPLRFDMRWECDSDALSAGLGAMILPQFSFDRPFCLDNRGDTTGNFVGFDIIPATGPAIAPGGGSALVEINPVTPQMGMAVRDMFEIANFADACCMEDTNCETSVARDPANYGPACSALQNIFVQLGDNTGIQRTEEGGQLLISRMRRFTIFDQLSNNAFGSAQYSMRLRGVFEGITPDGDLVTSTEFSTDVGFCRGCGMLQCTGD